MLVRHRVVKGLVAKPFQLDANWSLADAEPDTRHRLAVNAEGRGAGEPHPRPL
jgi:hypothetical protein